MTKTDLVKLKRTISVKKEEQANAIAEKKLLLERLKNDFGISQDKIDEYLESLSKDDKELSETIESECENIKETFAKFL